MTTPTPSEAGTSWTPLCAVDRLTPERAVAALTPDGAQVALVRLANDEVFAVGHRDPYALANVIARGVGQRCLQQGGRAAEAQAPCGHARVHGQRQRRQPGCHHGGGHHHGPRHGLHGGGGRPQQPAGRQAAQPGPDLIQA